MKHITILTASIVALAALSAKASIVDRLSFNVSSLSSSDISFVYPHPNYGPLDGIIKSKTGYALGLGYRLARFGEVELGANVSYQSIPLDRVTVGGQKKNWGDKIEGWAAGLTAHYSIIGPLYFGGGVGYQNMLGGAPYGQVEVGLRKLQVVTSRNGPNLSLSIARRYTGTSTYEGLEMSSSRQTMVALKYSLNF